MSERAISAQAFGGSSRPSKRFGRNRMCSHPECEVKLSMYNNGRFCYQHEPKSVPRTRGKKIA